MEPGLQQPLAEITGGVHPLPRTYSSNNCFGTLHLTSSKDCA